MNKLELVKQIADEADLQQNTSANFLNAFIKVIERTLAKGEGIMIPGFGSFFISERSARSARDFRTGKTITVPACKIVKFKLGKGLKEAVKR